MPIEYPNRPPTPVDPLDPEGNLSRLHRPGRLETPAVEPPPPPVLSQIEAGSYERQITPPPIATPLQPTRDQQQLRNAGTHAPTVTGPAQRGMDAAIQRGGFKPSESVIARQNERYQAVLDRQIARRNGLVGPMVPRDDLSAQDVLSGRDDSLFAGNRAIDRVLKQDDERPGFITSVALGIHTGNLAIGEAGGTVLRYLGGQLGIESMSELGEDIEAYFQPRIKQYVESANLPEGNVLDNPELLADGRFLTFQVANIIPALIGGGLIGAGVKKGVKHLLTNQLAKKIGAVGTVGKAAEQDPNRYLKIGKRVIDRSSLTEAGRATQAKLARLGRAGIIASLGAKAGQRVIKGGLEQGIERVSSGAGYLGFGAFAGAMEGSNTYREVFDTLIEQGASEDAARDAAENGFLQMTGAAMLLNAFGISRILQPLNGPTAAKNMARRFSRGLTEAITEYLEEPSEVLIKMGQDAITPEQAVQQLRDGTNVLLPSFLIGALLPGAGADFITAGQFRPGQTYDDVKQGTAETANAKITPQAPEGEVVSTGPAGKAAQTLSDEEIGRAQAKDLGIDETTTGLEEGEPAPAPRAVEDENAPEQVRERIDERAEAELEAAVEEGNAPLEAPPDELATIRVREAEEPVTEAGVPVERVIEATEPIEEAPGATRIRRDETEIHEGRIVGEGGGREGGENLQFEAGRAEGPAQANRPGEQPWAAVENAPPTPGAQIEPEDVVHSRDDLRAQSRPYEESLEKQIRSAGKVTGEQSQASARVVGSYVETKAQQMGVPVEEIWNRMGLRVKAEAPTKATGRTYRQDAAEVPQRSELGFYSQVEKNALDLRIPGWKDDKPIPSQQVWNKIKGTSGVKAEELQWMGLEEFLKSGKVTRTEALAFIRNNGVQVDEVRAASPTIASPQATLEWDDHPIDFEEAEGPDYIEQRIDEEIENDSANGNAPVFSEWVRQNYDLVTERLEKDLGYHLDLPEEGEFWDALINNDKVKLQKLDPNLDVDVYELVYDDILLDPEVRQHYREMLAQWYYDEGAEYEYTAELNGRVMSVRARSGTGYAMYDYGDGAGYRHAEDMDAVAVMEMMADQLKADGALIDEDAPMATRHGEYMRDHFESAGIMDEYFETRLTLPEVEGDFYTDAHFPERNIVAQIIGTLHNNGSETTYVAQEIQSDWHQSGRKAGYKTYLSAADEMQLIDAIAEATTYRQTEAREWAKAQQGVPSGMELETVSVGDPNTGGPQLDENGEPIKEYRYHGHATAGYIGPMMAKSEEQARRDVWAILRLADRQSEPNRRLQELKARYNAARSTVPQAPFKNDAWLALAMKRAIVSAIESGADRFAWSDAELLGERWSNQYINLYRNQYDRKMPSIFKKITGVKPTHDQSDNLWMAPLPKDLKEKVASTGLPLFQQGKGGKAPRASIELLPEETIVHLGQSADVSSFMHEAGHLFLEMEGEFAESSGASRQQQRDFRRVLNWFGVTQRADITREHHEQFARAFERYLGEGRAPSPELEGVFRRFAQWLKEVYRSLRGLNVELTPEIRQVFDRMLSYDAAVRKEAYDAVVVREKAATKKAAAKKKVTVRKPRTGRGGTSERVSFTGDERKQIAKVQQLAVKQAEELGYDAKDLEKKVAAAIREDRQNNAPSKGWARMTPAKIKWDKKKFAGVEYKTVPYSFHQEPKTGKAYTQSKESQARQRRRQGQLATRMVKMVREVEEAAAKGEAWAVRIMEQRTWYTGVTRRLHREFGAAADLVADLLGATSPITDVKSNYNQTMDAVRQLSEGKFDKIMGQFVQHIVDGGTPANYTGPRVTKINGTNYGANTDKAMMAMAKIWRVMRPEQAPKARNFTANLAGYSDAATIDVWAARMMQFLSGGRRIPPKAEGAVGGTLNKDLEPKGPFGFAQGVFDIAAKELAMAPKDLQAIAWFMTKREWDANKWTTKEGGSFEEELNKSRFHRALAGLSAQQGKRKSTLASIKKVQTRFKRFFSKDPNVAIFRQESSLGLYGGDQERAFDIEATVGPEFDIEPFVAEVAQVAQDNNQDSAFVSEVIAPDTSNPNARPGFEIYFDKQRTLEEIQPVLDMLVGQGIDGYTLVVDPLARIPGIGVKTKKPEEGKYIGVRYQFIPEFMAWDDDFLQDVQNRGLKVILDERADQLVDVTERLRQISGVHAVLNQYDTIVLWSKTYGNYTRTGQATNQAPGRSWFHQPASRGFEEAVEIVRAGTVRESSTAEGAGGVRGVQEPAGTATGGAGQARPGAKRIDHPPVRRDGRVELVHWSRKRGLKELDPSYHGTGIAGAESRRKQNDPKDWVDRTYYGIAIGLPGGYTKERSLGNEAYIASVDPDQLYDLQSDPLNLWQKAQASGWPGNSVITRYEKAIKDAGYAGYWASDNHLGLTAAVFDKLATESTNEADISTAEAFGAAEIPAGAQTEEVRLSDPKARKKAKGIEADKIRFHVLEYLQAFKGMVEVRVLQSQSELPKRLVKKGHQVNGLYVEPVKGGAPTVYLIADNLTSVEAAERVILHEIVGHLGIRSLPSFNEVLTKVSKAIDNMGGGNDPLLAKAVAEVKARNVGLEGDEFLEEVIAHLAERSTMRGAAMREIIATFKGLLRRLGFKTHFTSTDIMGIIRVSRYRMEQRAMMVAGLGVDPTSKTYQTVARSKHLRAIRTASNPQELGEALDQLAQEVDAVRASDAAGMHDNLDQKWAEKMNVPKAEMSWAERMKQAWDDFVAQDTMLSIRQGLVDSNEAIRKAEVEVYGGLLDASKSAYKQASTLKNLNNVMGAVLKHGIPMYHQGMFRHASGRMSFAEIFEPMQQIDTGENHIRNLEKYLVALRSKHLLEEDVRAGREDTKAAKEKLLDYQMVEETIAWAESQRASNGKTFREIFDEVRARWDELNHDNLQLAKSLGIIDESEMDVWLQHADYVPFWREASALEGRTPPGAGGGRIDVTSRGLFRLKGGLDRAGNPLKLEGNIIESMMMNTSFLLDRTYRNQATRRIISLGLNSGDAKFLGSKAKPVKTVSMTELADILWKAGILNAESAEQAEEALAEMSPGDRDMWHTFWSRIKPAGADVITVWKEGKPQYYTVSPLFLRSITGMQGHQFGQLMQLFRGAKKVLTFGVTVNPAFMLANWMRDTLQTFVVSDAPMVPIADAFKGLRKAYEDSPELLALAYAGRSGGEYYDSHPEDIRKLVKKMGVPEPEMNAFMKTIITPKHFVRWWLRVGSASEFSNRVALYDALVAKRATRVDELAASGLTPEDALQQALEEGMPSDAEAAYQAQDLLNFTRSGDYAATQTLIQIIPFLNARVQGLDRLYRGAKDNPMHFFSRGVGLTAAGLILAAINDDDERYRQLPEWDKDTYMHFWFGEEHFRLPKPFEVGAIFLTIPERMYSMGMGIEGYREFQQSMVHMLSETFAFNPVPQLVKPVLENYMNRSFFTDAPVVGLNLANLPPEAQYDYRTSLFARQVADAMPEAAPDWMRSPKRLQHFVRGYFGALGMGTLAAANTLTESAVYGPSRTAAEISAGGLAETPVIKRFYQQKVPTTTKYNKLLWEMVKEADGLATTMKKYREEGRFEAALGIHRENAPQLAVRKRLRKIATQVSDVNKRLNLNEINDKISAERRHEIRDRLNERKIALTKQIEPYIDLF